MRNNQVKVPPLKSRQKVQDFRNTLNALAKRKTRIKGESRIYIDSTKYGLRSAAVQNSEDRLYAYGQRRLETVGQIMILTGCIAKEGGVKASTRVEPCGALWQAFQGTGDVDACHTAPSLVKFDGKLPTVPTRNLALKRHLILAFADCVLMPSVINRRVDRSLDLMIGEAALVDCVGAVLKGATPLEATEGFREIMRENYRSLLSYSPTDLLAAASDVMTPSQSETRADGNARFVHDTIVTLDNSIMRLPANALNVYEGLVRAEMDQSRD
jgi:hypothetical protein